MSQKIVYLVHFFLFLCQNAALFIKYVYGFSNGTIGHVQNSKLVNCATIAQNKCLTLVIMHEKRNSRPVSNWPPRRAAKLILIHNIVGLKCKKVQFFAFIFYFRSSTNRFFSTLNFLEDFYWDESHEVPIATNFFWNFIKQN